MQWFKHSYIENLFTSLLKKLPKATFSINDQLRKDKMCKTLSKKNKIRIACQMHIRHIYNVFFSILDNELKQNYIDNLFSSKLNKWQNPKHFLFLEMNKRKVTLTTCLPVNSINCKILKFKRVKIYVELYVFEIFLCIDLLLLGRNLATIFQ